MSLHEHVLSSECRHGRTLDTCHANVCQEELTEHEEHAAREDLADAIANGEYDQGDAIDRIMDDVRASIGPAARNLVASEKTTISPERTP